VDGQRQTYNTVGEVSGQVVQAEYVGTVNLGLNQPTGRAAPVDPWAVRVSSSPLWAHVRPGDDTESVRAAAVDVAERLVPLRDEAEARLSEDPWLDPGLPVRFLGRLDDLFGDPDPARDLDLYPVEAALLVLAPLLFRVHELERAAARSASVFPGRLESESGAGTERASFQDFAQEHTVLVGRARRRRQDEQAVGWWLFHRWLLRPENAPGAESLAAVLDRAVEPENPLAKVLDPVRLVRIFHGLRRGPGVCNPEYLDRLGVDERAKGPGRQRVREQRLTLVLALAFGTALEMNSLPMIVVEHLAVPYPVDLDELRHTLEEAQWDDDRGLSILNAECRHEAVIEALRLYTARVDEMLHEIHRTVRLRINQPVLELPGRLSTDGVGPVEGGEFDGWARFRIDERKARELLTGVQLYKDRDLAIRELYQNALDACRYRRARTEYLDRTSLATYTFEGRIEFTQGVDEDGRRYVDCRDNGVGMGEAELRGVFSHAGERFAEQSEFLMEREAWESLDPPVELYPNSRFGIGVLSYFMLADEIRVTTCRMGADGSVSPVLEASIHGPGHLFRIVRTAERGSEPGTTVRLYLNSVSAPGGAWSCVNALGAVLGIADFHTSASDGHSNRIWLPGEPRLGKLKEIGPDSLPSIGVLGQQIVWGDAPQGVDVVWCENGGGLLVDGLKVETTPWSGPGGSNFTGVYINLSGPCAPQSLSTDRTRVLSDVSREVASLLQEAVEALRSADRNFWSYAWLSRLCKDNLLLADTVTSLAIRENLELETPGGLVNAGRTGYLPLDEALIASTRDVKYAESVGDSLRYGCADPDVELIVLWRLLLSDDRTRVEELLGLCPELTPPDHLRPGLPSDQFLVMGDRGGGTPWKLHRLPSLARALACGAHLGIGASTVLSRWRELGILGANPKIAERLLAYMDDCPGLWELVVDGRVGVMGEVRAALLAHLVRFTGLDGGALVDLLRRRGAEVPERTLRLVESAETDAVRELLFENSIGGVKLDSEWRGINRPILPDLARSLGASAADTCARVAVRGSEGVAELLARTSLVWTCADSGLSPSEAVASGSGLAGFTSPAAFDHAEIFHAARVGGLPPHEVTVRLNRCGVAVPVLPAVSDESLVWRLMMETRLLSWHGVKIGDPIPFARVLEAERVLATEPPPRADTREIVDALSELGVCTSCNDLPEGLGRLDAMRLMTSSGDSSQPGLVLPTDTPLSLHHLIVGSRRLDTSIAQVAEWFRALGYTVPDVTETVRTLFPRLPRKK
jgi:hypothetical protein